MPREEVEAKWPLSVVRPWSIDVKSNGGKSSIVSLAGAEGDLGAIAPPKSVLGIMQSPVWTLQASDTLRKAINFMGTAKGRHSPVLKGDRLAGVLCGCHVHLLLSPELNNAIEGRDPEALDRIRVADLIVGEPVSIGPYHSVVAAAQILIQRGLCALPVVEEQKVVGIVRQVDLVRALTERVKELEDVIAGPGGEGAL